MEFLTPELFDLFIIIVIILGLALAGIRLYDDFTRPLPGERSTSADTKPRRPEHDSTNS